MLIFNVFILRSTKSPPSPMRASTSPSLSSWRRLGALQKGSEVMAPKPSELHVLPEYDSVFVYTEREIFANLSEQHHVHDRGRLVGHLHKSRFTVLTACQPTYFLPQLKFVN